MPRLKSKIIFLASSKLRHRYQQSDLPLVVFTADDQLLPIFMANSLFFDRFYGLGFLLMQSKPCTFYPVLSPQSIAREQQQLPLLTNNQ